MHRLFLVLFCCSSLTFADSIFNFDNDPLDIYTPFADTNNGVTATFRSNGDPGGFSLTTYSSPNTSGNILFQPGPAGLDQLSLAVAFDQVLSRVELTFVINGSNTQPFTLQALLGSNVVGQVSATGNRIPGAIFPENRILFNSASFDNIILSSEALDFAVDNISVTPGTSVVPEPGTLWLSGSAVMMWLTVRQRISSRKVRSRCQLCEHA